MLVEIDFNSDEALYLQLTDQIIMGIATSRLHIGDPLPSVRQLADTVGINMHTVNKAYALLRQEGYIQMDRRRGAVIAVDMDRIKAIENLKEGLQGPIARAFCKDVKREDVYEVVAGIFDELEGV